ncbi:plasmid pRiA4b ORF-3 family protein [Rhodomicrobium sp. Az07]|uniref:plasmid pRiA4b ORF-3 family protein n=1 Tax=Rhodomicrobium sp. Az07 TaxID=2839034 RepID=UPI001BE99BE0|nr:plasmid pRiA4b ORF-3 family protein [Rhodomicrobium sp. Az07]MBT3070673.1 plasmid pRiA4b ORF-3 family protein [Rhodomicrobium sp. Az07]
MTTTAVPDSARLKITLLDLDPAPWREVEVPLSMTFKGLHDTIQAAFLWHNSHLWEFEVGDRRYGLPLDGDDDIKDATTARLVKLRDEGIAELLYTYDMGDNWEHHIEVVSLFEAPSDSRLPAFIAGQWRRPPEDVGGAPGFEAFLEALADPSHEEHDDLVDWYGADTFDREDIEPDVIKIQMARLAARRRSKK